MNAKLVLLIVALPLVFALTGGWQMHRAGNGETAQRIANLENVIQKVKEIQAQSGPTATFRTTSGKTYVASVELPKMNRALADLRNSQSWQNMAGKPAYWIEIIFGLSGAVIGGLGLMTIRNMGRKALSSREALLETFRSGQKLLPWLVGSVGFLTATALACFLIYEMVSYASTGLRGRGDAKLMMAGVGFAGFLLFYSGKLVWNIFKSSKAVFERDPMRLLGRAVSEEEAPKVWAFVREVAQKAGATMPSGIVLGLDECFFVTEHPVTLASGGPVPAGRILYMGLPYMAFMTRAEAAAVIGHELGHFTGADTEYSLQFSPIYASAVNNLRAVATTADAEDSSVVGWVSKPAFLLGEFFLDSFHLAVQHWSRIREFAADAMGASVAGSKAIALSLLRISVLAPKIDEILAENWNKGGKLPGGVLAGVQALVRKDGLADPKEHLEDAQSHPTDSHPPVRARLEALGIEPSDELLAEARSNEGSTLLYELGLAEAAVRSKEFAVEDDDAAATAPTGATKASAPLSKVLEDEFSQIAKENAEGITEELREAAAQGVEPKPFFEGGILLIILIATISFIPIAISIGGFAKSSSLLIPMGLAAAGLAGLVWCMKLYSRRKQPFLTFTKEGLLFGNLTTAVPWTAIDDYNITVNSYNGVTTSVEITVDLEDGYEPPAFSGGRVKYKAKKNLLVCSVMNLRGSVNGQSFSDDFATYWRGDCARAQLAKME